MPFGGGKIHNLGTIKENPLTHCPPPVLWWWGYLERGISISTHWPSRLQMGEKLFRRRTLPPCKTREKSDADHKVPASWTFWSPHSAKRSNTWFQCQKTSCPPRALKLCILSCRPDIPAVSLALFLKELDFMKTGSKTCYWPISAAEIMCS